jgi:hypothetical protein
LSVHARMLVHPILCAMVTDREHCDKFHALWKFRQWLSFTQTFGHEYRRSALAIRLRPDVVEYEVDHTTAG